MKKEVFCLYHFSAGELITKGSSKIAFMRRDATEFSPFGITPTLVSALETDINVFAETVTDVEMVGDQTGVTTDKDAKGEEIRVALRSVMSRVELKFGVKSKQYRKFGVEGLSHIPDSKLLITARRGVRYGTALLPALADNGLTAPMLTALTTLNFEFLKFIIDLREAIATRDLDQESRVEVGNAIYTTLVSFTNTGQSIWQETNVAKYNDYVLYNLAADAGPVVPPVVPTP